MIGRIDVCSLCLSPCYHHHLDYSRPLHCHSFISVHYLKQHIGADLSKRRRTMTDGPDSPIEDYTAPPNGSPPSTSTDSTVLIPPPSFPTEGITSVLTHDPPPPYPTPGRSRRPRGPRRSLGHHQQLSSGDSMDASETTTLLSPPRQGPGPGPRPRSNSNGSLWSNISGSPSLAHTMYTFFDGNEDDEDGASVRCNALYSPVLRRRSSDDDQVPTTRDSEPVDVRVEGRESRWRAYWRPVTKKTYYASVVHLMLVNFPMALFTWIALFVFTLVRYPPLLLIVVSPLLQLGTTLLMVLPLGLLLCFIDLLCARLLTRFEVHQPPCPYSST